MIKRILIGASIGLMAHMPMAAAELVTYEFTADVVFYDDFDQVLNGSVNVGDTITGTYTVDTDAPDTGNSYSKFYYPVQGDVGFDVQVGNHNVKTASYGGCHGLQYYNFYNDFDVFASWSDCDFEGTLPTSYAGIHLHDPTGTALTGDEDINTPPPPLEPWTDKTFDISGPGYFITANLTSLQLAGPEGGDAVEVIPAAGKLLAGQKFDLGLILDDTAGPVIGVQLMLNGTPADTSQCSPLMPLTTTSASMICEYFDGGLIPGMNMLEYEVNYLNGDSATGNVLWELLMPAY
ncbi:hypothetical protein ACFL2V_16465 [Pseudomonadota bacterium]